MSDYIEVKRILEHLDVMISALSFPLSVAGEEARAFVEGFKEARSFVERFPAADVMPVVRCKDCKHYLGLAKCEFEGHFSGGTDYFCANGEGMTAEMVAHECRWNRDEFCTNANCPMRGDYCPVPDTPDVCKHEDRYDIKIVTRDGKQHKL